LGFRARVRGSFTVTFRVSFKVRVRVSVMAIVSYGGPLATVALSYGGHEPPGLPGKLSLKWREGDCDHLS